MRSTTQVFKTGLFLAIALIAYACSSSEMPVDKNEDSIEVTYTESAAEGEERYIAALAIEGMACEMMCGNKIAGTLNGLDGVINTEIEFEGQGEINSALVEFDHDKLSEKEMIDAVQALAGGAYKVKSVNVIHYKVADSQGSGADNSQEGEKIGSYDQVPSYRVPSIFSIFTQLF